MSQEPKYKRNIFIHVNKFQQRILYPALVACFAGCTLALLVLDYFYYDKGALIHRLKHLEEVALMFIPLVAIILLLMAAWLYKISNRIVGPYERILRGMDDILEGKKRGPLTVREGDDLFEDLLERINRFLDKDHR